MAPKLRKTGISVVGDLPWGAHFCYFYETKQDLLDILIPYFKVGLENREFCLWVISNSELLTVDEAKSELRNAIPHLDRYVAERSIEIVGHEDWFLSGKTFDPHTVANQFRKKLNDALARGYDGMRVNGSPAWLHDAGPQELRKFEAELDKLFPNERTIASCTYPLAKIAANEIFDVARTHQFAIARRQGEWEVLETPELIQAKQEIRRLNEELEQRVVGRTNELRVANEELRQEITERKRAEEELKKEKEILEKIFDNIPMMIGFVGQDGRVKLVNPQWERTIGWTLKELQEQNVDIFAEAYPDVSYRQEVLNFVAASTGESVDLKIRVRDGRTIDAACAVVHLSDGTRVAIAQDITDRKQAEEQLRHSEVQLAQAQRLAHVGSWDWDLRTNKVTWSDELYRIFGLEPGTIMVAGDARSVIHPDDRDLVWTTVKNAVANKEQYGFYYRALRPDGTERIVHSRGAVLTDDHGEPIRVFGSSQDVTELKHAEEKLKATTEQLRALSASVQSAREEESKRIAREIHDELGGALTSWRWDLEEIRDDMSMPLDASQVATLRNKIGGMIKLTETTLDTVRRLASELRPAALELGLVQGLEWQTLQFENRTGIPAQLECDVEKIDLDNDQATAVFRILQEALTNIQRHAQATHVTITCGEESGKFVLTIKDNGRGITNSEESASQSLGLLGMRERANLVGGEINIESAAGEGTKITVWVPISASERS